MKMEEELAQSVEEEMGIRAMAEKLAPRSSTTLASMTPSLSHGSIEHKLVEIERLIRDIRAVSAQIKSQLG
jgi:hypothetical protein